MFNKRKTYFKLLLSICCDLLSIVLKPLLPVCNVSVRTLLKLPFLTNDQFPGNILTMQYRTICARLHRLYKTDICIGKGYKEINQNVRSLISGLWDYGLFLFFILYIFKVSTVSMGYIYKRKKLFSRKRKKKTFTNLGWLSFLLLKLERGERIFIECQLGLRHDTTCFTFNHKNSVWEEY